VLFLVTNSCSCIFQSLPKLNLATSFSQEKGITLSMQAFTQQECVQFFKTDLIGKGYRPLLVRIENKTFNTYTLSSSYFKSSLVGELELVPIASIIKSLKFNTFLLTATALIISRTLYIPLVSAALVSCVAMLNYNKAIASFLEKNGFDCASDLKIKPYHVIQKLIFFPESQFSSNFEVSFLSDETKTLTTFDVDILQYHPHVPHVTLA
jgi:hypothetical protein